MKNFTITETGKAEIGAIDTCPICGACYDGDTTTWDFVSNCWSKAPLTCGHGVALTENTNFTDDASLDNWQDSVLIFAEFRDELEALGYKEEVEEEAPDPLAAETFTCERCGSEAPADECFRVLIDPEDGHSDTIEICLDCYAERGEK